MSAGASVCVCVHVLNFIDKLQLHLKEALWTICSCNNFRHQQMALTSQLPAGVHLPNLPGPLSTYTFPLPLGTITGEQKRDIYQRTWCTVRAGYRQPTRRLRVRREKPRNLIGEGGARRELFIKGPTDWCELAYELAWCYIELNKKAKEEQDELRTARLATTQMATLGSFLPQGGNYTDGNFQQLGGNFLQQGGNYYTDGNFQQQGGNLVAEGNFQPQGGNQYACGNFQQGGNLHPQGGYQVADGNFQQQGGNEIADGNFQPQGGHQYAGGDVQQGGNQYTDGNFQLQGGNHYAGGDFQPQGGNHYTDGNFQLQGIPGQEVHAPDCECLNCQFPAEPGDFFCQPCKYVTPLDQCSCECIGCCTVAPPDDKGGEGTQMATSSHRAPTCSRREATSTRRSATSTQVATSSRRLATSSRRVATSSRIEGGNYTDGNFQQQGGNEVAEGSLQPQGGNQYAGGDFQQGGNQYTDGNFQPQGANL